MDNNSLEILFKLEIIFYKVDTTSVDTLLELDKLVILFLILLIKVFAVLIFEIVKFQNKGLLNPYIIYHIRILMMYKEIFERRKKYGELF